MKTSRDEILDRIKQNQPALVLLPDISGLTSGIGNAAEKFAGTLTAIGGVVIPVKSMRYVRSYVENTLPPAARKVTTLEDLADIAELVEKKAIDPHSMQNVDYAIIAARLAVAENGAVWVTEDGLGLRILPFICQHLAVVINASDIVADMHEAYRKIDKDNYGFGAFIAGPSKTADIEQSLVLGAHGPRSMTVFLLP